MKETEFIRQNKEKWAELESELSQESRDAQKLGRLFVQITDDLNYSRTFYPNRMVNFYLNNLTQVIYFRLYKNNKFRWKKLVNFWKTDLPQLMYSCRKELLVSFLIFLAAMLIGVLSSMNDPHFAESILGKEYVETTLQNIKNGDPMGIYKSGGQAYSFLRITMNNIQVAFLTFLLGIFCCIGSVYFLLYNGIMVGTFQYFFIRQGLFFTSFQTIWLHGTLEISSIIIAGAAGITLGRGLVWPGTYTRLQSFRIGAQRALKIMIGICPVFIMAGFIEGFMSRYTSAPAFLKLALITVSFLFVVGYFVVYPFMLAKKGFETPYRDVEIKGNSPAITGTDEIQNNGEILQQSFLLTSSYFKKFLSFALPLVIIYSLLVVFVVPSDIYHAFGYSNKTKVLRFFNYSNAPFLFFLNLATYSFILFLATIQVREFKKTAEPWKFMQLFTKCLTIVFLSLLFGLWDSVWSAGVFLLSLPLLIETYVFSVQRNTSILESIGKSVTLLGNAFLKPAGLYLALLFLGAATYLLVSSQLFYYYLDLISWNFQLSGIMQNNLLKLLLTIIMVLIACLLVFLLYITGMLLHFSLLEIETAGGLKKKLSLIINQK